MAVEPQPKLLPPGVILNALSRLPIQHRIRFTAGGILYEATPTGRPLDTLSDLERRMLSKYEVTFGVTQAAAAENVPSGLPVQLATSQMLSVRCTFFFGEGRNVARIEHTTGGYAQLVGSTVEHVFDAYTDNLFAVLVRLLQQSIPSELRRRADAVMRQQQMRNAYQNINTVSGGAVWTGIMQTSNTIGPAIGYGVTSTGVIYGR